MDLMESEIFLGALEYSDVRSPRENKQGQHPLWVVLLLPCTYSHSEDKSISVARFDRLSSGHKNTFRSASFNQHIASY